MAFYKQAKLANTLLLLLQQFRKKPKNSIYFQSQLKTYLDINSIGKVSMFSENKNILELPNDVI